MEASFENTFVTGSSFREHSSQWKQFWKTIFGSGVTIFNIIHVTYTSTV